MTEKTSFICNQYFLELTIYELDNFGVFNECIVR